MLPYNLDDLDEISRAAGSDGASVTVRPTPAQDRPEDDYADLMGAWLNERSQVVETELLLARARDLLIRAIYSEKSPSTSLRREIRRLLGEIDDQLP